MIMPAPNRRNRSRRVCILQWCAMLGGKCCTPGPTTPCSNASGTARGSGVQLSRTPLATRPPRRPPPPPSSSEQMKCYGGALWPRPAWRALSPSASGQVNWKRGAKATGRLNPNAFVAQRSTETAVCARRAPLPPLGCLESIARSRIGRPLHAGAGRPPSHLQRSDVFAASFAAHLRDARLLVVDDLHASPRVTSRVHHQLLVVVRTARRLAPPWRQIVPVKQQRRHALPPFAAQPSRTFPNLPEPSREPEEVAEVAKVAVACPTSLTPGDAKIQIGRASCRERV